MKLFLKRPSRTVLVTAASAFMCLCTASAIAQASLSNGTPTYTQNFNTLPVPNGSDTITEFPWTNNTTLASWYMFDAGGAVVRFYAAGHVTDNTGFTDTESQLVRTGSGRAFSWGSPATSTDRALGTIVSSTKGARAIGLRLKNNGTAAITSMTVAYTGEQWCNQNTVANTLSFSYTSSASAITTLNPASITEAGYTAVAGLDFVSLQSGGAASNVIDGNLPANRTVRNSSITGLNIPAGNEIMLRWYDADDSGSDAALAIDDLTVIVTYSTAAVEKWGLY